MLFRSKVSSLAKHLTFNPSTSSLDLITAINYFSSVDGNLDQKLPTDFLNQDEKNALYKEDKLRVSFYKVLLFSHMSNAIKSGHLNLLYSYKYKAIHEYLIDEKIWASQRKDLIERAGLTDFCDFQATMNKFKLQLDGKYKTVNERILAGKNIHLKIDKNGKAIIQTPKTDNDEKEYKETEMETTREEYETMIGVIDHYEHSLSIVLKPRERRFTIENIQFIVPAKKTKERSEEHTSELQSH